MAPLYQIAARMKLQLAVNKARSWKSITPKELGRWHRPSNETKSGVIKSVEDMSKHLPRLGNVLIREVENWKLKGLF